MCGYPQLVTQVHVLNAEGLQGQDSNGGKTACSELRPGSQIPCKQVQQRHRLALLSVSSNPLCFMYKPADFYSVTLQI